MSSRIIFTLGLAMFAYTWFLDRSIEGLIFWGVLVILYRIDTIEDGR